MQNDDNEDIEQELEEESSDEMPRVQNHQNSRPSNLMRGLNNINSKNKNGNNENGGVINQVKDKAGKATENVGKGVKATGKGMEAAGKGAEVAGKGMQAAGKGMEAAGSGLSAAGKALSSTGAGAIAGVPLSVLGGATKAAGKGTEAAGKGTETAGKGAQKAGQAVKKSGEGIKQAGNSLRNKQATGDNNKDKEPKKQSGSLAPQQGENSSSGLNPMKLLAGGNILSNIKNLPTTQKIQLAVKFGIPGMIIIAIIFAILIIISIFIGFSATTMNDSFCKDDNSTSGTTEVTAADTKDFLCKMQSPLGNKSYPIFGWVGEQRPTHVHQGVDLSPVCGTPIYAVQGGTVHSAGWEGGYGNSVIIKHSNGKLYTRYGHMSQKLVNKGETIKKGQLIGKVGNTGNSYGCHLHFEVREKAPYGTAVKAINDYFNASPATHYSKTHKIYSISDSFKKQCGSTWQGDPIGSSLDSSSEEVSTTSSNCCVSESSSSSNNSSDYCSNGIIVGGKNIDFETYVAGVVTAENSYINGKNIEASKANAVAARTYAVNRTDNCKSSIGNSQAAQVYKSPGTIGKNAASETAGQVMLYNGKVFSSQYDSFCSSSGTATYTKVPSSSTHSISLNSKFRSAIAGGHCQGMSQLYARQLQDEGKKYDEILKFFYADGIEITGVSSNNCSIGGDSFNGDIVPFYQYNYAKNSYGDGTIASKGCGPTAMAMAVSSLLRVKHDPVELADFSTKNGCYVSGVGTAWTFFKKAGDRYGLDVKQLDKTNSGEVLTALNGGKSLVIAAMGNGTFTKGGHFILLTGTKNGKVTIQDPASEERSKKSWDFQDPIVKEASQFWIISKK